VQHRVSKNDLYSLFSFSDIMFAAVVVSLFGVFYTPGTPSPRAAFVSVVSGAITRVVMEFALPKDGLLLLPFEKDEFLDYGPGASSKFPVFFDEPAADLWDPATEPCDQDYFKDFTGVDSLAAPIVALLTFVAVQMIENCTGKPLFTFSGLEAYEKELGHENKDETEITKKEPQKEDSGESSDDKNEVGETSEA
jgi:hypothetical protein